MSNFNLDFVDQVNELCFENYQEFKTWLNEEHGDNTQEFISPVISLVSDEHIFRKYWKICDQFQSGNVMYRRN